jgi:hypothetical protein
MSDASRSRADRPGPIAQQRARNARLLAQAEQLAARHAEHDSTNAVAPEGWSSRVVAVLPANTRNTTPLPEASQDAFLERLREVIDRVFREPVRDNAAPMSEADRASRHDAQETPAIEAVADWPDYGPELAAIQGASCGTCRGECCTAGGTHAFLRDDSITRVRAQLADDGAEPSADSLLAIYREHLPARHYRDSCIYHTTTGCALPRSLRSNLCNRYVCGALTQLTRTLAAGGQREAYVAAADSVHLRRMALVSVDGTQALSLRSS